MQVETLTPREQDILRLIAQGYSNKRIAETLVITVGTVKWYNKQIYAKLGVDNRTQATLHARHMGIASGQSPGPELARQVSLPHSQTPLIGRENEIEEIAYQLLQSDCRLLSLVGPGGSGKTRLAIEVARQVDSVDGAYFVPLQPLRASENIVTAIIDVLPLQLSGSDDPHKQLLQYLRNLNVLLVLDNFEHLLDRLDIVLDIVRETQRVKLLVTSRERLNLRIEHVRPVLGLEVPKTVDAKPQSFSAIKLFVRQARRTRSDFSFDDHRAAVIRICQLVDGLPLALDLAATWVRVMPCTAIADEIQQNIDILETTQRDVPKRHRSMRAVFDHSWHLLTEAEQLTVSRLAVFRGGFTSDAAEQVTGEGLQMLASLIDKSLVQVTDGGRYDQHELIRQYAEERLLEVGQFETALDAHCDYYTHFMCDQHETLMGPRVLEALDTVAADFENIRTAWTHAVEQHRLDLIDCALDSLCIFCEKRGLLWDGIEQLQHARNMLAQQIDTEHSPLWGRLVIRHTEMKHSAANPSQRMKQVEAFLTDIQWALRIAQEQNDWEEVAYCLRVQGVVEVTQHNFKDALQLYDESLKLFTDLRNTYYMTRVMLDQVFCFGVIGQGDKADNLAQKTADFARIQGNQTSLVDALVFLVWGYLYVEGDLDKAQSAYAEALDLAIEAEYLAKISVIWFHSSVLAIFKGDFEEAASLGNKILLIARQYYAQHEAFGFGNVVLGLALGLQGQYRQSMQHGLEGRPYLVRPIWRIIADLNITIAAWGLKDYRTLATYLLPMLRVATSTKRDMLLISVLPCAAMWLAQTGREQQAVEILALAWTHPKAPIHWFDNWGLMTNLRSDLEDALGSDRYAAAWKVGTQRDLLKTVRGLLHDLHPGKSAVVSRANQALTEPLSPRELEVLLLVSGGLANREIAERLFVSVSTVKKHINHIYGKLNVKNRTSALARARALNLLP